MQTELLTCELYSMVFHELYYHDVNKLKTKHDRSRQAQLSI